MAAESRFVELELLFCSRSSLRSRCGRSNVSYRFKNVTEVSAWRMIPPKKGVQTVRQWHPEHREHSPAVVQPRQGARLCLDVEVAVRRPGQNAYCVRVHDLSPRGCKLDFVERPMVHDRVWVRFQTLEPIEGAVRWVDGFVAGVQFTKPIHPAVFDLLVGRLK